MGEKTILSCGHEDEHSCMGVSVQFDEEQCVAGEGFVPTTIYAQYCHECATKLYESRIAALIEAGNRLNELACHQDDCQIVTHGVWSDPIPCTCGYTEAWKKWKEVRGE